MGRSRDDPQVLVGRVTVALRDEPNASADMIYKRVRGRRRDVYGSYVRYERTPSV